MKIVSTLLVAFVLLLATTHAFGFMGLFSGSRTVQAQGGDIRIPVSDVSDGNAHHFRFTGAGPELKFFLIRSGEKLRTAFNACDVCYHAKKGYSQEKEFMVCNKCGMRFHTSRIGDAKGGCNPAPLPNRVEGGDVVISVADLAAGEVFFK